MQLPSNHDSAWEWLRFGQSGIVTYAQAVQHLSPAYIRHKLERGDWRRVYRGVIATTPGRPTVEQQWNAAVLAAGEGAVLAGLAAARAGGMRLRSRRAVVDVLTEKRVAPTLKPLVMEMSVVKVHRTTRLEREDIQLGKPMRTTVARSVVDAAQWASNDDEAREIVAAACQQKRVTPGEIFDALEHLPRAKRRALVIETAEYAEGGATTLTEIDFVRLCAKYGLPKPDLQVRRKDASGRIRFLDAYFQEQKLHIEIDGAHHMRVGHWTADMLRQNEVWLKGDRVLRFPAHLLRTQPELVVEQIGKALQG